MFCSLIAFTDKEPKDFMVPSRWGTVSYRNILSKRVLSDIYPDRQKRRSIRATTIEWLLYDNVKAPIAATQRIIHEQTSDISPLHPCVHSQAFGGEWTRARYSQPQLHVLLE